MKDQLAEIIGRGHYGLYNWERIKFGQFPDVSLEDAQWVFDTAEEICKMLFPEGEKPPVISDEDIKAWIISNKEASAEAVEELLPPLAWSLEAQRDDTYEKTLAEVCEEIEKVENPFGGKLTLDPEYGAFEQCRKQILARFKEVKNGS